MTGEDMGWYKWCNY